MAGQCEEGSGVSKAPAVRAGAKPIVGLCGAIGSGKSTVAAEFGRQGCCVIDSDALNHAVLREPAVAGQLAEWWGKEILGPDGRPDRRKLAGIVFSDPAARQRLESLTHPLIAERRAAIIAEASKDAAFAAIVLDSPLLFESNLVQTCDAVVFVAVSDHERKQRLKRTRKWDADEVSRREQWQLPVAEKRRQADFVIDNEGERAALERQVAEILARL